MTRKQILQMPSLLERSWPLPALLAWASGWLILLATGRLELPLWTGVLAGILAGGCLALLEHSPWRRLIMLGGFPLSLAVSGAGNAVPFWIWPLALGVLVLLYPLNAWRDAPLFPTPEGILENLPSLAPLPAKAGILDAGCGLGAGLRELHRIYPTAQLTGLEWSWPLRLICGLRCPYATVRRGDIWKAEWSGYNLVYMFQRPESMAPAYAKARREMRPGSWLVSLEFEVPDVRPHTILQNGTRPVLIYQL